MKHLINDIKAAMLYLYYFQIIEELAQEPEIKINELPMVQRITGQLILMGYENPTKVAFDEDGLPNDITWKLSEHRDSYDWIQELYEAIDFSPAFFDITS